jgi:hypothetical protein
MPGPPFPETEEPAWLRIEEAQMYLGLDPADPESEAELERIIDEYDIDVEVSDVGRIIGADPEGLKEALLDRYVKKTGHRHDDPKEHDKAMEKLEKDKVKRKEGRHQRKVLLKRRLAARAAAAKASGNGG